MDAIFNTTEFTVSQLILSISTSEKYIRKFMKILQEHRTKQGFDLSEVVSQVFVRINSEKTPLKQNDFIFMLLSVHWEEVRKKIERFYKESKVLTFG